MTGFVGALVVATRRTGLAAAFVGAALLLAPGFAVPAAEAGNARSDLALGPGGSGSDAEGRIQVKHHRRGDRIKIRLENLEPRTDYEVRDGATDEVLGTVRTNRRGRAKGSIRGDAGENLAGMFLEVCETGSDDPVLEGTVPDDGGGNGWWEGSYRYGTVSTDPEAEIQVAITLSSQDLGAGPDGTAWDGKEGDREGTYESIYLSVSPNYAWVAEDGGEFELPSIPGPVTFWISDGEELVKVATVEKSEGYFVQLPEVVDNPRNSVQLLEFPGGVFDGGWNDDGDGHDGDDGDGKDDDGDDGWDDYPVPDFYYWYADNTTEEGLPFGVEAVDELSLRRFEVRDGEGHVLLDGVLPELEEPEYVPLPEPLPDPGICPFDGIHIDISIFIDLSGIDWGSFDWGSFDWGSFDWGSIDWGSFDWESFDWGSIDFGDYLDDFECDFDFEDYENYFPF